MQSLTRAARVIVVGRAGKAPRIIVIRPRIGVCGAAHVNRAHCGSALAVHTVDRVRRRVRKTGVGRRRTGVRRDHHRRVCLGDAVVDRATGIVVVGCACEAPLITVVGAGIGVMVSLTSTVPTVAPVSPFTP